MMIDLGDGLYSMSVNSLPSYSFIRRRESEWVGHWVGNGDEALSGIKHVGTAFKWRSIDTTISDVVLVVPIEML